MAASVARSVFDQRTFSTDGTRPLVGGDVPLPGVDPRVKVAQSLGDGFDWFRKAFAPQGYEILGLGPVSGLVGRDKRFGLG